MQIRHPVDERLVFDRDGATWNFPAAVSGRLQVRVKPLSGGRGGRICLLDRWLNPTDPVVEDYATYVLGFDGEGRIEGETTLRVDAWNTVTFEWENSAGGKCLVRAKETGVVRRLPCRRKSVHGLSYVHFQSPAEGPDSKGYLVESVEAAVE